MKSNYVLCVKNIDYEASLECFKVYKCITDSTAMNHQHIRVFDESGEDYLFPSDFFVGINIPISVQKAIELKCQK
ncbi:MAG: hypothetical protein H8E60_00090 [Candidatus Marinimicrobia bacterium]|nr:hypothetical protein [Candidatus Neomarinimicrobiota bacterium]